MRRHWVVGLVLALGSAAVACGSDSGGTGGPGSGSATGTAGAGGSTGTSTGTGGSGGAGGSTPGVCIGCSATQGCLRVNVTRTADDANQPWKVWPMEVDGVGTLIVSATPTGGSPVRKTQDNADMKPATASYVVDVGCVPTGMVTVDVFLDDNGNAAPTAITSSDYRDSCGNPRSISVTVTAGQTSEPMFPLANSCD